MLRDAGKLVWLKVTIAAALLCSLGLCWRLWTSSRLFPLSPLSALLPAIPAPLDKVLLLLLLGLLLAILVVARPRRLILAFLVLSGLLSFWDQTRWQPWFYQYFFLLAAVGLYAWREPQARNAVSALLACRLIVVFTYLWSGLQKLNAAFVTETWPDMADPLLRFLPEALHRLPPSLALIVPLFEIFIGLGLLTRRARDLAVGLAVATHAFVLLLLVASRENTVVWPWNIAMAALVVILFWRDKESTPLAILAPRNALQALLLLLFALLPALSLFDLWDSYLSSALYSGNTHQAVILVSPAVVDRLPAAVQPYVWRKSPPFFLDINRWAYGELNVPAYPEPRIYRNVAAQVCTYAQDPSDIKLMVRTKPDALSGRRIAEYYDCDHLDSR